VRIQAKLLQILAVLRPVHPATQKHPERILIIKLDRIGDFVLSTSFLRELRRSKPGAWIVFVTSQIVSGLALHCPYVDELVTVPTIQPGLRGQLTHWKDWCDIALGKLLPLRPSLAILPRWDVDLYDAFPLLALSGARKRISYSVLVEPFKTTKNKGYDRFLTQAIRATSGRHEVEKNLGLLPSIGLSYEKTFLELWPVADPWSLLRRLLPGREHHRLVALCPLSAEEFKNWPLPSFLQVVENFRKISSLTFILIVGPEYSGISEMAAVHAQTNLVSLAGKLSLDETAALLGRCELTITVDTGLMHIAAARGCPLVVVSALAPGSQSDSRYSPDRFGPWQADCTLLAPPNDASGPRQIDAVTVEEVTAAVTARLIRA